MSFDKDTQAGICHQQLKVLHTMLGATGLQGQKAALVAGVTQGRTESSRELTSAEADTIIAYLKTQQPAHKMRRKLIGLAHEMNWHLAGTRKVDMERVNAWCVSNGYLHKPLNDYTVKELPKLVSQYELVYKHYLSNL
jgi:hypothetical protein